MARQRPTRIPTPHRCYIKRQFWVGKAYVGGVPGPVMGTWMVEIDRGVIRDVEYFVGNSMPRCSSHPPCVTGASRVSGP
ncbi:hypothetical protein DPMN_081680 [Dreissena polymorpha]|uniref:Uncharacterized protein n=1 Tax=Dreissena polymorpha TaxID=45954 RepID=A0A9D4BG53_DREPO|nr:hypothetical protein DPMN_081680 [Dreissena polymorpha]